MKRWNIIIEVPAQQDIAEAHQWLAERDPRATDRWFDGIYDTMAGWRFFPGAARWRRKAHS